MAKYVSRYTYHTLTGPNPGDPTIQFGTQDLTQPGVYVTTNAAEIAFIEAHPAFGVSVFKDEVPQPEDPGVVYDDKDKLAALLDAIFQV